MDTATIPTIPEVTHEVNTSTLIAEAERTVREAIKYFGLTTKPENILLTIQSKGRRNAIGWFAAESWKNGNPDSAAIHEINLSAEYLSSHNMGETLLHELAHAENKTNGIKDCSAAQMHNKKFKVMAEKLGLLVKPRDKRYGYGFTDLDTAGAEFLKAIDFKAELFAVSRLGRMAKSTQTTRLIKLACPACGYTVRTTQKWLDVGLPVCPCGDMMGLDA